MLSPPMSSSRSSLTSRPELSLALDSCFDAFSSREPVSTPDQVRGRLSLENALNRLVALVCAGVLGLDAPPVDDHATADGDAIGLGTQRFAHRRGKLRPDARGPARSAEVGARRRDSHLLRV